MPRTTDNTRATATAVTSETMYIEGEPSVQTRPEARAVTVSKKGRGWGTSAPIARKEPRNLQRG